jgi:AbrB family looped-hinge helix DNA binding protein
MAVRILKVDRKGRMLIPKEIRERLALKDKVRGTVADGTLVIEPTSDILDKLSKHVKFRFRSIETALPALRLAAAKQLRREAESP